MKRLFAFVAAACLVQSAAVADAADRLHEAILTGSTLTANNTARTTLVTGKATLEQGSLRIAGDSLLIHNDADGYKTVTMVAAPGATGTFRQKVDGASGGWVEATGKRIVYDERLGRIDVDGELRMTHTPG